MYLKTRLHKSRSKSSASARAFSALARARCLETTTTTLEFTSFSLSRTSVSRGARMFGVCFAAWGGIKWVHEIGGMMFC